MKETLFKLSEMARQFGSKDGHRFAAIEGNRDCNRSCSYCAVPSKYLREREATVDETCQRVDWLYDQGYRLLTYLGGEPLAEPKDVGNNPDDRFVTKEGFTFFEHTLQVINHASNKGMAVNITTNGDYLDSDKVTALKKAGLDTISLSLHTFTETGLNHLLRGGRLAAQVGIIPTIHTVFTADRTGQLPDMAAKVAQNGMLFGFGIIQEKGGDFSNRQQSSLVPSVEQQKEVLGKFLRLKTFGFVRNNRNALLHATDFYPNNWTCDPERDAFIHIGADGRVSVCSDIRTGLQVADIQSLDDSKWRDLKRVKVASCGNCFYHCYYEAQNPAVAGDIPMAAVALLIRGGRADIAEKWGQFAVRVVSRLDKRNRELSGGASG